MTIRKGDGKVKELIINGRAIKSIWKTDDKHSGEITATYPKKHKGLAHRDPTASAAIGNIMREERRKAKQQNQN